jgi:diguanylate cyclase (GGDEF)-like protein
MPTIRPVASRLLTPPARGRARQAIRALREAPDHYALIDQRRAGHLAGFLFCCAGVIAAVMLAFDPPTGPFDDSGWLPAALLILLAFVCGLAMIINRRAMRTNQLMLVGMSGPAMLGTLQWLAGGDAAYAQLLILSVLWSASVLPPFRLAVIAGLDALVVFLPGLYGQHGDVLAQDIATIGIVWTLAVCCAVHAERMRNIRRTLVGERLEADELARVDALTGLGNRRALDEALVAQVALAARADRPLSALVGDLDAFKQINDRFGHHGGDRILEDVAGVMRDVVRSPDSCFRWGGDEFVILLAEADLAEAEEVGARVAAAIADRCTTPDGTPITISLGAAEHTVGQSGNRLLAIADAALLAAKAGARSAV